MLPFPLVFKPCLQFLFLNIFSSEFGLIFQFVQRTAAVCPRSKNSTGRHMGATSPCASVSSSHLQQQLQSSLLHLWAIRLSLCVAVPISRAPSPPSPQITHCFSQSPRSRLPHSPQNSHPTLLKSAAIKTHAGLKCQKRISNCQNINLFTLRCHTFPRGKGWGWGWGRWRLKPSCLWGQARGSWCMQ